MAQDGNIFCIRFIETFGRIFIDYDFWKRNKDSDRADLTQKVYETENQYSKSYNNAPLLQQQRCLSIPLIEKSLGDINVEIGTGNGEVIKYLAEKHPDKLFIGTDLFLKDMPRLPNLKFIKGYPLDIEIAGALLFVNSTFMMLAPRELIKYLKLDFKTIIINEPNWGGYRQRNNHKAVSYHMEYTNWFHNYCGYLRQAGYRIEYFEFFKYKPLGSTRPDVWEIIVKGKLLKWDVRFKKRRF